MKKEVIVSEGSKSQSVTNSFSQGRIPPYTSRNSQFLGKGSSFYPTYATTREAKTFSTHHRMAQMLAHTFRQV